LAWFFLIVAGIFEVVWAISLKYSNGFTRLFPSIITLIGMIISFVFLTLALKHLSIGTAYAIWTGIGAVGTVLLGIMLFGEAATPARLILITMIVAGIIGLKLTS
jgi:quaternary ammonium compound-resistance protein SugE